MKNLNSNFIKEYIIKIVVPIIIIYSINTKTQAQTVIPVGASQTYAKIYDAYNSISEPLSTSYIIEIQSDYNVSNETQITLNYKSGASASNYILICPALNVSKTITGTSSSGTVSFNSATFVTIDGTYRGGTSSLTIANSSSSGVTVMFVNDAVNNTVKNCTITGRNSSTSSGVIYLSTANSGNGNDYNFILSNTITKYSTYRPANLIYSSGTSGKENDNNTISGNSIYDFTNCGIYVTNTGNGNNWIIGGESSQEGNSIYQVTNSSTAQTGIFLKAGTTTSGHVIKNNYIGGSTVQCGGSAWCNTGGVAFVGIKLNVSTSTYGVMVSYNTVKNFNMTSTSSSAIFYGIYPDSGSMYIEHNTIGDENTANSITTSAPALICGIFSESLFNVDIKYNSISNITMTSTSNTDKPKLRGVRHSNKIGRSYGKVTISNNTVHHLKSAGRIPFSDGTIYGIVYCDSSIYSQGEISNNDIHDLCCNSTTGANVYMAGIEVDEYAYNADVFNNRICGLYNYNATDPMIGGIITHIDYGTSVNHNINIYNNMIALNNSQNAQLYGIWDAGSVTNTTTFNVFYNTIYLSGTVSSGTNQSACYNRGFTGATPTNLPTKSVTYLKNNIFINTRSGGSGKHYAIINAPDATVLPTTGWSTKYSNYNFLVTSNSSNAGGWGQGSSFSSYNFSSWINQTGTMKQDYNSWYLESSALNITNFFTDTSTANLNIKSDQSEGWYVKGKGIAGIMSGNIATDINGNARSTTFGFGTSIGANEFIPSSTPPLPNITGTISVDSIQTITSAGKTLGTLQWTGGTALPTALSFEYFSGSVPPGTLYGKYSNCYWTITQTGGSNFSYNLILNYDSADVGTIDNELNIRLAKRDGGPWTTYLNSTVNTTNKTITLNNLNSFSDFALSDVNEPMPVHIEYFTFNIKGRNVGLKWKTTSEINNKGFEVQRLEKGVYKYLGFLAAKNGTSNEYNFEDKNLQPGRYNYRLKQIDLNGNFEYFSLSNEIAINAPNSFELSQNYPNPFNPVTRINFSIAKSGLVKLVIYDITGREVKKLVDKELEQGFHFADFNASNLSSGIYFYTLKSNNFVSTKKMVLVK
ncbi:MAG: T9SS type A sorting domain-containing protein [Ignavibacteriae bacterium]|nr:T9SS type A sorting domain-containing protein [Ignavibacteriota bacterium]